MNQTIEGRNSASPDEAASFVSEFNRLEQDREELLHELDLEFREKKRKINKGINEDQKKILADGKSQGVHKGVIRALAHHQKQLRKARIIIEEKATSQIDALEDDDREQAKSIREALGDNFIDLPLGRAAVQREEADATTRAIVDAVAADEPSAVAAE